MDAQIAHVVDGKDLAEVNRMQGANIGQHRWMLADSIVAKSDGQVYPVIKQRGGWEKVYRLPLGHEVVVGRDGPTGLESVIHSVITTLNTLNQPTPEQDRDLIGREYGFGYSTDGDIGKGYH